MNYLKNVLLLTLIIFSSDFYSQTIQIYHGLQGNSGIIKEGNRYGKMDKFIFDEGNIITIEIINAHPALYNYTFNNEEIEIIDPESPDISTLLAFLSTDLNISNAANTKANGRVPLTTKGYPKEWPKIYSDTLLYFKDKINKAEVIILNSDSPKDIKDALSHNSNGGFLYAKKELAKIDLLQIKDLDAYIIELKSKFKQEYDFDKTDIELTLIELYNNYLNILTDKLKSIQKAYGKNVSAIETYIITLNSKVNKITLNISGKNEKINMRETGEKIIEIEITPNYKRPVLELVPVVLMHKAKGGKNFGIENGILTESNREEFNFSVGATLNLNLLHWGKYKEYSFATGLGFALTENTLDNFFLNANLSYKKWVRFGVGYGFLRTPTGLNDNLKAGGSAANISNISDVISFERKPAVFFSIVIPGLTLPLN
tara:strand:+ start:150 stop:1436 length:1287 start_codon:yes stop_codon:yes gene_type:complete